MKSIRIFAVLAFALIILAPIATFNFEEDAISEIDNRKLAANPFSDDSSNSGDLTDDIENYINDRVGLRDKMILSYTVLNDKLFNKMVHPSYVYGENGYVFGAGLTVKTPFTDYHEVFAEMIEKVQRYCDERQTPFLFVFNPAKPAVLTEHISKGINYNRDWVQKFLKELDKRGVDYIDNTVVLRQKNEEGEIVFNQKYDANHWNDLGAYYGTNAILEHLQEKNPAVHVNTYEELSISYDEQTTLPVSNFPIKEMVPSILLDIKAVNRADLYNKEIELHPSHKSFGYYVNEVRLKENSPKVLVFQGSYMNGLGSKYLANSFSEYIHIHDYQNVIDFPYYYNIFKPDYVVFEAAEYTFAEKYFNYEAMNKMNMNPTLESISSKEPDKELRVLESKDLLIEKGEELTKIQWKSHETKEFVWLYLKEEYDMKKNENGYEVTVLNKDYEEYNNYMKIITFQDKKLTVYNSLLN